MSEKSKLTLDELKDWFSKYNTIIDMIQEMDINAWSTLEDIEVCDSDLSVTVYFEATTYEGTEHTSASFTLNDLLSPSEWRTLEKARIAEEKIKMELKAIEDRTEATEKRDRATYLRLKAKFEE